jgi:Tol biopolymer transport system component
MLNLLFVWGEEKDRGIEVRVRELGGEYAVDGKRFAVLIAVDRYRNWIPLKNPVKDAREIKSILERRYYFDEVIELFDDQATKAGINRLFGKLIERLKPEDSVFIFFAGHGYLDPLSQTGFWIPVDGGTDRFSQENWIPNSQIRGFMASMKSRHVALASDSCFSGDILNPSRGIQGEINNEYFKNAYRRVSRQVLTSGASEPVPDASSFARQLKLALEGNRQPYLDCLMLYDQVRLGVSGSLPLFGALKDAGHQEGGSFLFFLKEESAAAAAEARSVEKKPAAKPAVPKQEKIAFLSLREKGEQVYAMNLDGSEQKRLTDLGKLKEQIRLSPDGKRVFFMSASKQSDRKVYPGVVNLDGSDLTIFEAEDASLNGRPSAEWSRKGDMVALTTEGRETNGTWTNSMLIAQLSNHAVRPVMQDPMDPGFIDSMDWSPDDTKIVSVISFGEETDSDIYVLDVSGRTPPKNLTNKRARYAKPTWSSDGRKIVYASDRNGNMDVYLMNYDGSGAANLSANAAEEGCASWAPDGSLILWERYTPTGAQEGYSMDIVVARTDGKIIDVFTGFKLPAWNKHAGSTFFSPDGKKVLVLAEVTGEEAYLLLDIGTGEAKPITDKNVVVPIHWRNGRFFEWVAEGRGIVFQGAFRGDEVDDVALYDLESGLTVNLTNTFNVWDGFESPNRN